MDMTTCVVAEVGAGESDLTEEVELWRVKRGAVFEAQCVARCPDGIDQARKVASVARPGVYEMWTPAGVGLGVLTVGECGGVREDPPVDDEVEEGAAAAA